MKRSQELNHRLGEDKMVEDKDLVRFDCGSLTGASFSLMIEQFLTSCARISSHGLMSMRPDGLDFSHRHSGCIRSVDH